MVNLTPTHTEVTTTPYLRAQLRTEPCGHKCAAGAGDCDVEYFVGVSEPPVAEDEESDVEVMSLAGWRLSDDPASPSKRTFPAGGEYLGGQISCGAVR